MALVLVAAHMEYRRVRAPVSGPAIACARLRGISCDAAGDYVPKLLKLHVSVAGAGLHVPLRRAGQPANGCGVRRRGLPGPGRGRRLVRPAVVHDGRAAGRERPREPRARAHRDSQLRLRVTRRTGSPSTSRPPIVRKAGTSFDLPIALGILAASRRRRAAATSPISSCSASCRSTDRSTPRAACCRSRSRRAATGWPACCCRRRTPAKRRSSAGLEVLAVSSLADAVRALNGRADRRARCRHLPHRPCLPALGRRSRRRPRPAARAPRPRGRRGRRAQPPARRPARRRQDDDGAAARRDSAAARLDEALDVTAVHSVAGLLPPGAGLIARAAVPRAASHHLERGAGRRRLAAAAGRSQPRAPRRAVSRRDARVQPPRARSAAPAARRGRGHDRARRAHGGVPRALHARRRR